jgi:hypothetical protein
MEESDDGGWMAGWRIELINNGVCRRDLIEELKKIIEK